MSRGVRRQIAIVGRRRSLEPDGRHRQARGGRSAIGRCSPGRSTRWRRAGRRADRRRDVGRPPRRAGRRAVAAARRHRGRRRRRARQDSVRAGFAAFDRTPGPDGERVVLVHDAARPLVDRRSSTAVAEATARHGAAIPVVPVARDAQADRRGSSSARPSTGPGSARPRRPQGVRRGPPADGSRRRSRRDGPRHSTDEAALLEACSIAVHVVPGDPGNLKVTLPADLERAASLLAAARRDADRVRPRQPPVRAGTAAAARRRGDRRRAAAPRPLRRRRRAACGLRRAARRGRARRPRAALPGRRADAARHRQRGTRRGGASTARGSRLAPGDASTSRSSARGRAGAPTSTPMRDAIAGLLGVDRVGGQRQGVDRQPRGRRRRRPRDLGAGDRDASRRPDDAPAARHASGETRRSCRSSRHRPASTRCGPTVYGPAHIGNFRSFLFADLLVRLPALARLPGHAGS